jgi:hypothetical protein
MRFISNITRLRVVLKPTRTTTIDGVRERVPGETCEFQMVPSGGGEFETKDPKVIKMLKADPGYQNDFAADIPPVEPKEKGKGKGKGKASKAK